MNKEAILYKYAKAYTYLIKQAAFFNRQLIPRHSTIAKGLARKAWDLHNTSWNMYGDQVGLNGRLTPHAQQNRLETVRNGMQSMVAKYQPEIGYPAMQYSDDAIRYYGNNIHGLSDYIKENPATITPYGFAQRVFAYPQYHRRGNINNVNLGEALTQRVDAENARQFYTSRMPEEWRPYLNNEPLRIEYIGNDNGSITLGGDKGVTLELRNPGIINPYIYGHEGAHTTNKLLPPDSLTENSVAPLFGRRILNSTKPAKSSDFTPEDYLIAPDGTRLNASQVRLHEELRANDMQRRIIDQAIAEGNIPRKDAKLLKELSERAAARSNNSYLNAIEEVDNGTVYPISPEDLKRSIRIMAADNRRNKINVKKILDVKPADRIWNRAVLHNDERISTIDAVGSLLDTRIAEIQRVVDNLTANNSQVPELLVAELGKAKTARQWLTNNRAAIQENMGLIRNANRNLAHRKRIVAKLQRMDEAEELATREDGGIMALIQRALKSMFRHSGMSTKEVTRPMRPIGEIRSSNPEKQEIIDRLRDRYYALLRRSRVLPEDTELWYETNQGNFDYWGNK